LPRATQTKKKKEPARNLQLLSVLRLVVAQKSVSLQSTPAMLMPDVQLLELIKLMPTDGAAIRAIKHCDTPLLKSNPALNDWLAQQIAENQKLNTSALDKKLAALQRPAPEAKQAEAAVPIPIPAPEPEAKIDWGTLEAVFSLSLEQISSRLRQLSPDAEFKDWNSCMQKLLPLLIVDMERKPVQHTLQRLKQNEKGGVDTLRARLIAYSTKQQPCGLCGDSDFQWRFLKCKNSKRCKTTIHVECKAIAAERQVARTFDYTAAKEFKCDHRTGFNSCVAEAAQPVEKRQRV
jgi:hypothetical protein